jgi:hypothetical protein
MPCVRERDQHDVWVEFIERSGQGEAVFAAFSAMRMLAVVATTEVTCLTSPYSLDLRMRVMNDVERGMSAEEAAMKYSVSRRTVHLWKSRYRETGSVAKIPRTKPGPGRLFPLDNLPKLEMLLNEGATTYGWINDL